MRSRISETACPVAPVRLFHQRGRNEELVAEQRRQLAVVELGNEDLLEVREHRAQVARERVQVAEVEARDGEPVLLRGLDRGRDRAVRAAPADDQQVAAVAAEELDRRDLVRDAGHLLGPQLHHPRVVRRVVRHVAGALGLRESPDAVLEARRARDRPRARERLGIARVRLEAFGLGRELDVAARKRRDVRNQPRLGAVREVAVREDDDGRHVAHRQLERLEDRVEAVARRRRGEHRQRALAVASVQREQQVPLLDLRRHAGRRAGPLDVDDHERKLGHHREAERLLLEDHARSARRRDREIARETQRRSSR